MSPLSRLPRKDDATPAAHAFHAHLTEHAGEYFPEIGPRSVDVSLRREDARPYSTMYEFRIDGGATDRAVLVKQAAARERAYLPRDTPIRDRPGAAGVVDPARNTEAEFKAVEMIHPPFGRLADPRFG